MELSRLKFWANLALVIATTYIIICYIFMPTNNQCQMTFMMEPPKFIPVPVDESPNKDESLSYPSITVRGSPKKTEKYKLFMYSEFGFPQASDVSRDLKDSMPVLFVPGNAGSYQQVRSLASTCIRRQLQSLDAFKFIFYTIDFRGQLSGLSGQLIEDQTSFVERSLNQIAKIHPTETNGIILIGHSVGGFISKVLFTRPSFNPNSVPLLISLASPLTQPYLTFDSKMQELYDKTQKFWSNKKEIVNHSTIAISISGGKSDRLVPMHLSMDPQYDFSLTTSSMKDVWLATDHVCITWCRELMHKLAHLLSALMDKRQICLIGDREKAMSIIMKELFVIDKSSYHQEHSNVIHKDWRTMRSHTLIDFQDFYSASRSQLSEGITILNMTGGWLEDLLIWIDHIEPLKENGLFGCRRLNLTTMNGQINCLERIDLTHLALPVPSRKFEPKKTILKLKFSDTFPINYIILDFLGYDQRLPNQVGNKIPESLIIQKMNSSRKNSLYIPSLFEFIFKKFLLIESYQYKITPYASRSLIYMKYIIKNLNQVTQIFSIKYESHSCRSNEQPNGATILFSHNGLFSESFYPTNDNGKDGSLIVIAKISSKQSVQSNAIRNNGGDQSSFLEFYIDGTCENSLRIELDLLDLIVDCIQRSLGEILTCLTYLSYVSIIASARTKMETSKKSLFHDSTYSAAQFLGYIFIHIASKQFSTKSETEEVSLEQLISFLIIYFLSQGAKAFLEYFIERVIDLGTIIYNAQSLLRQIITTKVANPINGASSNGFVNGSNHKAQNSDSQKSLATDFDWLLISLTIAGSLVFSAALISSLFTLFIVIKLELSCQIARAKNDELVDKRSSLSSNNKHCSRSNGNQTEESRLNHQSVHNLLISIAVLCGLALLSNVPAALVRINKSNTLDSLDIMLNPVYLDMSFLAATFSLLLVKLVCERIEFEYLNSVLKMNPSGDKQRSFRFFPSVHFEDYLPLRHIYLVALIPTVMIESNLSHMNFVLLALLTWLINYAQSHQQVAARSLGKTCEKIKTR